ncbi:YheC/YheD family protein [Paenibacillus sp. D2_2]|uniref:YheC/YheD family endospore coat-associated protein n=1 Tax=Paenibacillus sp. D2_2 TaxID=3073092 RepID=UPI002815579B|nr:YheC/YheD family protein [Paenibacillus sp. D2_2]WMT40208.1 YheC/YheD family protein [Paenibacillus sp. D2_2]
MGPDQIGILLNSNMYRGIPTRRTGQESINNYEEVAEEFDLIPCFLRLGDIDLKQGKCIAYMYNGREYAKAIITIPKVIHNRALYTDPAAHSNVLQLISQGTIMFNANNRYRKDLIHKMLWDNKYLRSYLPVSVSATSSGLQQMMEQYSDLILKPVRGSVGHGIIRLRKGNKGWETIHYSVRKKSWIIAQLYPRNLPLWLGNLLARTPYFLQERIPLLEYNDRPLDLRVTVQKGINGSWNVTGLYAKVAPSDSFISNIAKGGTAYQAPTLLNNLLSAPLVAGILAHVKSLSLTIASELSANLPMLADIGLDIGLTDNGHPFFIECNGRDQRYGFRKAGMTNIWKDTYRTPMAYARYLLNHQKLTVSEDSDMDLL